MSLRLVVLAKRASELWSVVGDGGGIEDGVRWCEVEIEVRRKGRGVIQE